MAPVDETPAQILAELHCHTQFFGWQHFSRRRLRVNYPRFRSAQKRGLLRKASLRWLPASSTAAPDTGVLHNLPPLKPRPS
jgi:hypothetical protein